VKQAADLNLNDTDLMTLAVKPQIMDYICDELKERLNKDVPILSIAAGKDIAYFEKHFSVDQPIIRAMPNLPATIGQGMSVMVANTAVTDAHKQMVETLLSANGKTLWIEDESKMDAVTALSGSGPAYLFYFIEALAEAGQTIGLSEEEAMTLAKQTIIGASALVDTSEEEPSELREAVTSKAGTTESALKVLMDVKFQAVLNEALKAAKERSQELSL
jgi:pyrroline-5-carboxylate reductase